MSYCQQSGEFNQGSDSPVSFESTQRPDTMATLCATTVFKPLAARCPSRGVNETKISPAIWHLLTLQRKFGCRANDQIIGRYVSTLVRAYFEHHFILHFRNLIKSRQYLVIGRSRDACGSLLRTPVHPYNANDSHLDLQ